jgi:hypothetical protein
MYFLRRGVSRVWGVSVVAWQRQEEWRNKIFHIHSIVTFKLAKVVYVQFSRDSGAVESSTDPRCGQ